MNERAGRLILVTGGCGYIGSHVSLALIEAGYQPVILDDLSNGDRGLAAPGAPLHVGDAGDAALLARIHADRPIDAIMHFAGKIVVPESVAHPLDYYATNTLASHALIRFATQIGVPFVFSSTAAVYGAVRNPRPVSETDPLAPISPYGRSKLMVEMMLEDVSAAHGLRYTALRYFNVAGADAAGRAGQVGRQVSHLIRTACHVALGLQEELVVFGTDYPTRDGTCERDYIHVSDLADLHVRALDRLIRGGGSSVFNCGYGRSASVRQVVAALDRVLGRKLPVREGARRPGDPPVILASSDRAQRVLGWSPRFDDLDLMVASALAWERSRLRRVVEAAA